MKTNSNAKPIYIEGDDLNADWIKNADPEAQKADIAAGEEARKMHTNDGDKTKESGMSFLEFVTGQASTATTKHLAGKHDQDRHGRRAGGNATPEQLAARRRVAANRAEEKREDKNGGKKMPVSTEAYEDRKRRILNELEDANVVSLAEAKRYAKVTEMNDGRLSVEFAGQSAGTLYPSKSRTGGETYRISRGAHMESKRYNSRDEAVHALVSVPGSSRRLADFKRERTQSLNYYRREKKRIEAVLQTATGSKREDYLGMLDWVNRGIENNK